MEKPIRVIIVKEEPEYTEGQIAFAQGIVGMFIVLSLFVTYQMFKVHPVIMSCGFGAVIICGLVGALAEGIAGR